MEGWTKSYLLEWKSLLQYSRVVEYDEHDNYDDEDNDKRYSFMDRSPLRRDYNVLIKQYEPSRRNYSNHYIGEIFMIRVAWSSIHCTLKNL